jgi:hypothetical protein
MGKDANRKSIVMFDSVIKPKKQSIINNEIIINADEISLKSQRISRIDEH